ncbi:hypothetical protein GPECTOR_589g657 [Gonium pectorale]|uniref:Uncharacterized protein n=1 Tax=Gonium pectorale TaxID=33097 RepID=A0A150FW61_GONPE|nr:hypothetical protein GPECTOR_589g657 [Gonium pectorale]|eukprot:KXZ41270.1 hypothetical protein GPECTOR_589g657 [Gonium pectorale]
MDAVVVRIGCEALRAAKALLLRKQAPPGGGGVCLERWLADAVDWWRLAGAAARHTLSFALVISEKKVVVDALGWQTQLDRFKLASGEPRQAAALLATLAKLLRRTDPRVVVAPDYSVWLCALTAAGPEEVSRTCPAATSGASEASAAEVLPASGTPQGASGAEAARASWRALLLEDVALLGGALELAVADGFSPS